MQHYDSSDYVSVRDNHFDTADAGYGYTGINVRRLKHLNLEQNDISAVPQLEPKVIKHDRIPEAGSNGLDDINEVEETKEDANAGEEEDDDTKSNLEAKEKSLSMSLLMKRYYFT